MNFYNEIDPFAAAWLRELIKADLIAPGVVDERPIQEITPSELKQYTQCHFFAGIGVWSYALRAAGWPDDVPVWTGSCPCQPFSCAGTRKGTTDERHLWPSWFHLISQCKPPIVFGEQVESAVRFGWLDLVQTDMEGIGYSFGSAVLPAAGFGAPHMRHRLFFVANSTGKEHWGWRTVGTSVRADASQTPPSESEGVGRERQKSDASDDGTVRELGNTKFTGLQRHREPRSLEPEERRQDSDGHSSETSLRNSGCELASDSSSVRCDERRETESLTAEEGWQQESFGAGELSGGAEGLCGSPSLVNGFWRKADWLFCRDGKYRPVEPSTFPLVNGTPARVGRLRGYGNAIVAPVATGFITAAIETIEQS